MSLWMEYLTLAVSLSALCLAALVMWGRGRAKALPSLPSTGGRDIHAALAELHERSKPSAGRLHLHEVEEVIRRRLG